MQISINKTLRVSNGSSIKDKAAEKNLSNRVSVNPIEMKNKETKRSTSSQVITAIKVVSVFTLVLLCLIKAKDLMTSKAEQPLDPDEVLCKTKCRALCALRNNPSGSNVFRNPKFFDPWGGCEEVCEQVFAENFGDVDDKGQIIENTPTSGCLEHDILSQAQNEFPDNWRRCFLLSFFEFVSILYNFMTSSLTLVSHVITQEKIWSRELVAA